MSPSSNELNFLLKHITNNTTVLEWGSGVSTVALAKAAKRVISIEHNEDWQRIVGERLRTHSINNCLVYYVPPNLQQADPMSDGDFIEYRDYCLFPLSMHAMHPDVAFVDGRARLICMIIALSLCRDVFIHDFGTPEPTRSNYNEILRIADVIDSVETMYHLRLKDSYALDL